MNNLIMKYALLVFILAFEFVHVLAMEQERLDKETLPIGVLIRCGNDATRALFEAARKGCVEIVEDLIVKHGANISARCDNGYTPLHWAALCGNTETSKKLIAFGADVNARNRQGDMPLHFAAIQGYIKTVIVLLECGADVNVKGFLSTPLSYAYCGQNRETVIALLEHGAVDSSIMLHGVVNNGYCIKAAQAFLLADRKCKTKEQLQASHNRILTVACLCSILKERQEIIPDFLFFEQVKALPELPELSRDLQKLIMLNLPEDVFSVDMLAALLPLADKEQMKGLIQHCPRAWFVQAVRDWDQERKNGVVREIERHAIEQATERCNVRNEVGKIAYDVALADEFKQLLYPDDPKGVRATFIFDRVGREFN